MYVPCILYSLLSRPTNAQNTHTHTHIHTQIYTVYIYIYIYIDNILYVVITPRDYTSIYSHKARNFHVL
jgi:hypothetical protein